MTTKRRFIRHLPLMLAGLAMGLGVFVNIQSKTVDSSVIESSAASSYYDGITATGGTTLLGQLHDLSVQKHTNYNSYSGDISTTNCIKTDPYPNTSYVMDFYTGAPTKNQITSSGSTGWNREHVWCQNLSNGLYGTNGAGADIQHIRPTIPTLNSDRGNKKYGELNNSGTASTATDANGNTVYGGYYSGDVFQPMDNKKGDAARIVMYLYMHYNKASNVGGSSTDNSYFGTLNFTHVISANSESAAIKLLLAWNTSDPVDSIETTRNEEAAKITGCRNPFIDNSNYANLIWGSGSSSTDPSASISPSSASVAVGGNVNLIATLSNVSNASLITWTSSDTTKATVSKGTTSTSSSVATVTGVAAGSTTIYCKYNGTTIGSALVTVTTSGGSGGGDSDYTLVTSNSSLSNGDKVVIATNETTPKGVTGWNNNKDATVSTSSESWMQYTVGSASSSGFTLKDETASNYIASPGGNEFKYGTAGTVSVDSEGHCVCNSRYLCINGSNYRFYTSIGSYTPFFIYKVNAASSKTLSSIAVSTVPTKTSYNAGQYFDPTGLVIRRNYSDNTNDTYSYAGHTSEFSFLPSTSTALTVSNTSVTITYGGKSTTQAITVTAVPKTLSSISVSGQTTSFTLGDSFSFGGTVTATFSDSSTSDVTSSATFSGYNMNSAGNQIVTVSYTYSGTTITTSYTITVSPERTVLEETSSQGTITWSSQVATVSTGFSATVTNVEYTYYEDNSLRLGTGSGGGQLRIETDANIVSVVVTAKAYADNRKGNLSVGGQNLNVQSTNYTTFDLLTLATPTKSLVISTASSSVRINIQSVVLNCLDTTDISSTEDCLGLESFIENYMHMDYTQNLGYCKDNTHHYYSTAKSAFNNLNTHQRSLFVSNSAYASEFARLSAWASANGESFNSNNQLSQRSTLSISPVILEKNSSIIVLVLFTLMGATAIGAYVYSSKKKASK